MNGRGSRGFVHADSARASGVKGYGTRVVCQGRRRYAKMASRKEFVIALARIFPPPDPRNFLHLPGHYLIKTVVPTLSERTRAEWGK